MCPDGDETVDPTKPEWSRRRPTSAQRDLERQARNSPSEMLYPPGVDYGFPSCARVPGSLRGMGSSCSPEQLDGLTAVKGVRTETDRKISSPPRNRRVVDRDMKLAVEPPSAQAQGSQQDDSTLQVSLPGGGLATLVHPCRGPPGLIPSG
ncbi:hypothetical protein C8R43DRAFT_1243103 [Mycena crocata]|nr:hypothetical protein C8R43DRAFT_1243103 [Mycena crocata]